MRVKEECNDLDDWPDDCRVKTTVFLVAHPSPIPHFCSQCLLLACLEVWPTARPFYVIAWSLCVELLVPAAVSSPNGVQVTHEMHLIKPS